MAFNVKDVCGGLLLSLIGVAFAIGALTNLRLGTAFRMGPGYFPLLLGGLLAILGLVITIKSLRIVPERMSAPSWRAVVLVTLAPILFGSTIRGLGLIGASLLTIGAGSFASRTTGPFFGIVLAFGLTAFCVVIFVYGLGLPFSLVGPWLRF